VGNVKRTILIVVGVAGVLAAVSAGLTLYKYNQATKIDRSVAKVVVRQYLDAVLAERDEARAQLFVCDQPGDLSAIESLLQDIQERESRSQASTQIALSQSTEMEGGSKVDVELQLNQGDGTDVRTRIVYIRFFMKNEGGWRVCSAERLPDPSSTPSTQPTTG
jgi:hypothetical protein